MTNIHFEILIEAKSMDDITGLGKLAESKFVTSIYDDAVSAGAKEAGKALQDITKTFRLFLAPFQLLSIAQDRLSKFCERVRNDVPAERQIEAAPEIATPVLLALRYMDDDNLVTELFVNLLKKAIDRNYVQEVHPSFPKIIEQLSADEAIILYSLGEIDHLLVMQEADQDNRFPFHRLKHPENTELYCDHLESLSLISFQASFIQRTRFGTAFIKACVPERIEGMPPFHLDASNLNDA